MRADHFKSWPYPVLRPLSGDYQHVDLQVTFQPLDRRLGTTAFTVDIDFDLSDPDLLHLIDTRQAEYAVLGVCSRTHFRQTFASSEPRITFAAKDGEVAGVLELTPFVVTTTALAHFSAKSWHPDYRRSTFDIDSGSVLAIDSNQEYVIDLAEETPIGSSIEVNGVKTLEPGKWNCDLGKERIVLQMSEPDYKSFRAAREAVKSTPDAAYIMNAIYLPGLIYAMTQADQSPQDYESLRWYRSVDARLADLELPPLGTQGVDRVLHAQTIFGSPFAAMPLLQAPMLTERAGA